MGSPNSSPGTPPLGAPRGKKITSTLHPPTEFSTKIGGWGCGTVVRQHPNREIDFDCACVCVACVRAKLRVRDVSAVAGCGLVEKPGGPSLPPSGPLSPSQNHSLVLCWLVIIPVNQCVLSPVPFVSFAALLICANRCQSMRNRC